MSLIGVRGSFDIAPVAVGDLDAILPAIESRLRSAGATRIERDRGHLSFRSGFFMTSWNVLAPVGWATIDVEPGTPGVVRYDFSLTLVFLALGTGLVFFAGGLIQSALHDRTTLVMFGLFCVVVAAYWGSAWIRLPSFVHDAVDSAIWGPSSSKCPNCGHAYRPDDYRDGAREWRCEACGASLPHLGTR